MRTAMSNETKETGSSFMEKLSTVIVDKRNLIFLLTIILLVFLRLFPQLGRGRERPDVLPAV